MRRNHKRVSRRVTYADAALLKWIAEVRSVEFAKRVLHVVSCPEVDDPATLVIL